LADELGKKSAQEDKTVPGEKAPSLPPKKRRTSSRLATRVFFTGNKKKPEVTDKHVYRIYRKILGFDVLFSDEISKKYLILYGE